MMQRLVFATIFTFAVVLVGIKSAHAKTLSLTDARVEMAKYHMPSMTMEDMAFCRNTMADVNQEIQNAPTDYTAEMKNDLYEAYVIFESLADEMKTADNQHNFVLTDGEFVKPIDGLGYSILGDWDPANVKMKTCARIAGGARALIGLVSFKTVLEKGPPEGVTAPKNMDAGLSVMEQIQRKLVASSNLDVLDCNAVTRAHLLISRDKKSVGYNIFKMWLLPFASRIESGAINVDTISKTSNFWAVFDESGPEAVRNLTGYYEKRQFCHNKIVTIFQGLQR